MVFIKAILSLVLLITIALIYFVIKKLLRKVFRKTKRTFRGILSGAILLIVAISLSFISILTVGTDVPYIKINTDSTDIPATLSDGDLVLRYNEQKVFTTREYKEHLKKKNKYEDYQIVYLHDGIEEYAKISANGDDAYSIGVVCGDDNKLSKVYGIAEKTGLKVGDEILSISGIPVTKEYAAKKILEDYKIDSSPVLLAYKRDGKESRVNIIPVKEGIKTTQFRVSGAYTKEVPDLIGSALNEVRVDAQAVLSLNLAMLLSEPIHVFIFHILIAWMVFAFVLALLFIFVFSILNVMRKIMKINNRTIKNIKTVLYIVIVPLYVLIMHVLGVIQSL